MTLKVEEFGVVRKLVLERTAIAVGDDQAYLVESRLLPVARRVDCASLSLLGRSLAQRALRTASSASGRSDDHQ